MATAHEVAGALTPMQAIALVGVLGVGAQWIAWRARMPAIVVMLAAGILVGPVLGLLDPARDIGPLTQSLIGIAVAVILFEGGLTLDLHAVQVAAKGVRRLVIVGAPVGWLLSASALHYVAGLGWAASTVFGGIMIVTGPTVIAPLLRQARLSKRPAMLLQWEGIVNDPIGALAAVLAFEIVAVRQTGLGFGEAMGELVLGISFALVVGWLAAKLVTRSFRRGWVPEYMKVPVLFVLLIAVFAATDSLLHESGLLAVTVMGLIIANSDLPSFTELRRFKEHATVLLVSGVFILLASSLDFASLAALNWRALAFVASVMLLVRPLTVMISLAGTDIPMKERLLVAFTGPRGIVLIAVAGLFGERLTGLNVPGAEAIAPLAFVLVAATVVIDGFTLIPKARFLGLVGSARPGVLIVGGSRWATGLARVLQKLDVPVQISDPNHARLRGARSEGVPTFFGDILSETAEHNLEFVAYQQVIAATGNDAYNTLVATDLGPEFGRENVYQVARVKSESSRHALPASLGGRAFGDNATWWEFDRRMSAGWSFRDTNITEEFTLEDWRARNPEAVVVGRVKPDGDFRILAHDIEWKAPAGTRLVWYGPSDADDTERRREKRDEREAKKSDAAARKAARDGVSVPAPVSDIPGAPDAPPS